MILKTGYNKNLRRITLVLFIVLSTTWLHISAQIVQHNEKGYAINGYDPVAYFTMDTAIEGKTEYSYSYKNVTWLFINERHLVAFKKDPEKYMPQYGGYCAYGVRFGRKVTTDSHNFSIVNDRLYLNLNKKIKARWEKRPGYFIKKADNKWKKEKK